MKKNCLLIFIFAGLILLINCAPRQSYFRDYIKHSFYNDAASHPVWATTMGVHDYDSQWPEYSEQSMRQYFEESRIMLRYDTTGWSIDDRVDYRIEVAALKLTLHYNVDNSGWRNSPSMYITTIFDGLASLAFYEALTFDKKQEAFISRLKGIPSFLEKALDNLKSTSDIDFRCASLTTFMLSDLIQEYSKVLIDSLPSRNAEISTIRDKALIAIDDFPEAIREKFQENGYSELSDSKEDIDFYIKEFLFLDFDTDSLTNLAEAEFARCDSLYKFYQLLIPEKKEPKFRYDNVHLWLPENKLTEYCQYEIGQIAKFLKDENILEAPDIIGNIEFKHLPDYIKRMGYKSDIMLIPAPLDKSVKPVYYVNFDFHESRDDSSAFGIAYDPLFQEQLIENIIPGTYYQYYLAHKNKSFLRDSPEPSMASNGWRIYIRELICQRGFFDSEYELLAEFYKDLRDQALATIIEVGMHTGRFDFASAYAYVESKLGVEDAREYTTTDYCTCIYPEYHMETLLGRLMIIQMREKARAKSGDNFDLADFHEKLLSEGNIPLPLIAWKYGWE